MAVNSVRKQRNFVRIPVGINLFCKDAWSSKILSRNTFATVPLMLGLSIHVVFRCGSCQAKDMSFFQFPSLDKSVNEERLYLSMRTSPSTKNKHPVRALLFLTNPTMVLLAVLLLLFSWRIPTRARIDLIVEASGGIEKEHVIRNIQNKLITVREGCISYPDFPDLGEIQFTFPERLEFEAENVHIDILDSPPSPGKQNIRLEGVFTRLLVRASETVSDRRLTQFDRVKASPELIWTGIGLWLVATIIGWLRVYQELNR